MSDEWKGSEPHAEWWDETQRHRRRPWVRWVIVALIYAFMLLALGLLVFFLWVLA